MKNPLEHTKRDFEEYLYEEVCEKVKYDLKAGLLLAIWRPLSFNCFGPVREKLYRKYGIWNE